MATSLAAIRAKLQASENRGGGNKQSGGDSAVYPHWDIAEGTTARIRFLPDADAKNDFFWIERLVIKLPFAGIKGQPDSKPTFVQVPCVEMWGEACPILAEVRTWYKDESLKETANKYWKKRSYLFQGFVHENPLGDDKTPENPIRRFIISPQIFTLIKNAVLDPELPNLPTDYQEGLDFNIKKTSKGGYADYSTSGFARRETALTAEEAEAIEKFGLYNLADFLPKKPSEQELRIIKEMFEASVDGEPYDPERFGAYYKPAGFRGNDNESAAAPAAAPVAQARPAVAAPAPAAAEPQPWEDDAAEAAEAPVVTPAAAKPASQKAEDILAMIRNRQK
jgi:hypothetical protein